MRAPVPQLPPPTVTERFQEFLRLRTVSGEGPNGSYQAAVDFLAGYCRDVGLETQEVLELVPNKPILVAKWIGCEPGLPCVLLNSHYDVVPADEERWTEADAFSGELKDGRIYGRGAQDMKCVPIQQLEALRRLKERGWTPRRTLVMTFVPDEEIGGADGMSALLSSPHFEALGPIGIALDEGIANPNDAYTVFYGERGAWWIIVTATGNAGHASRFIPETAVAKLNTVLQRAMAFRAEQAARLEGGCSHATATKLGDVTTVNVTMLNAGVSADGGQTFALNVIPTTATLGMDVRIPPSMPMEEMRALVDEWASEEGVTWEFAPWGGATLMEHFVTELDEETNPWWPLFRSTLENEVGVPLEQEIFPAATDSRFLRQLGVRAIGFSPINNTPQLLHDHNEYLSEEVLLRGCDVFTTLLDALLSAERLAGE